jgi:hypothetical protein
MIKRKYVTWQNISSRIFEIAKIEWADSKSIEKVRFLSKKNWEGITAQIVLKPIVTTGPLNADMRISRCRSNL